MYQLLQEAEAEVSGPWGQEQYVYEAQVRARLKDEPAGDALELKVANELVDELSRRFYARIRENFKDRVRA